MTKVKSAIKSTEDAELEIEESTIDNDQEITPVVDDVEVTEDQEEGNDDESDEAGQSDETEEVEESEDGSDKLEVKASYNNKTKVAVASTDVVDRHGESINQEGWDLKSFKANPVMLWAHDHSEISVGNAKNIHIEKKSGKPRLVFTPEFHDKTPTAKALKELFEEGWLNSFSVGFIPKDFDGKTSTYLKQELLEISAVNVPANPEARMLAYKTLKKSGFSKDVIKNITTIGNDEKDAEEESETKQTLVERLKGALADEIAENEMMKQKYDNMKKFHDLSWAFCDVYYDQETPVEDFETLLAEYVVEINKLINGTSPISDDETDEEVVEDAVVLDKVTDKSEDDNNEVKAQVNDDTSAAPEKKERAKQSLTKVIARASDKLLDGEKKGSTSSDRTEMIKVIKRAAEILNASHKAK